MEEIAEIGLFTRYMDSWGFPSVKSPEAVSGGSLNP
jgi:hypothetical protein